MKNINIGIIGLGLIGGSLALKLAENGLSVYAFARKPESCTNAMLKIYGIDCLDVLSECRLIFICTPLREILPVLERIQKYLSPGTLISDVGSVKSFICKGAGEMMRKDCHFIGGHPMAGTEKQGFLNSFSSLFEGKAWVLSEENDLLCKIIKLTGAQIVYADAEKHDRAVALISHLPLMLSIGLLNTLDNFPEEDIQILAKKLASSGFVSMTRLARGNSVLNEDLLSFNEKRIKEAYEIFLSNVKCL